MPKPPAMPSVAPPAMGGAHAGVPFAAPAFGFPPQAAPAPPPAPVPQPSTLQKYLPLILVLNVFVLLAIVLILVFVLRHK